MDFDRVKTLRSLLILIRIFFEVTARKRALNAVTKGRENETVPQKVKVVLSVKSNLPTRHHQYDKIKSLYLSASTRKVRESRKHELMSIWVAIISKRAITISFILISIAFNYWLDLLKNYGKNFNYGFLSSH